MCVRARGVSVKSDVAYELAGLSSKMSVCALQESAAASDSFMNFSTHKI